MSISFTGCNMVATALKNIPMDKDRRYLAMVASADTAVTISEGTPFTVLAGDVWSPIPAPINGIVFVGAGTLILG